MDSSPPSPFEARTRLGDALVEMGLLSALQIEEAMRMQREWGSRLGDIILAKGWARPLDFYRALATHYQRPFVDMLHSPPQAELMVTKDITLYADLLVLPWKKEGDRITVAVADPNDAAVNFARQRFGDDVDFVVTSKFDIIWQLQQNADNYFSERAINQLNTRDPDQSARRVFTGWQMTVLGAVFLVMIACLGLWTKNTLIALGFITSLFFLLNFALRAILTWVGGDRRIDLKITQDMVDQLDERKLPIYTVLVPMYHEHNTLPILTSALRRMDYPLSKLDVKLVLEEDDQETIQAAKDLGLEGFFEIIRVPPSLPKTKPKACNYALHFARGEYITIFDAEDKPDPDQFKKVVVAFQQAPENVVCIQARLNYFNSTENWLARMFTLEYSIWFDYYLPALDILRIPIPLGGTSNHFKMRVLREVNAWDPYNVTEDADLGVRLTQLNYKVGVVNSTTYEEANNHLGNWLRQRSRWIKGYMQTYLVHMRNPRALYRTLGHVGFWGFQFFIGGTIVSALLLPILYAIYIFWLLTNTTAMDIFFPTAVLYMSLFNLLIGNGFFIYIYMLGAFKRGNYGLIPYALTVPVYWLLMSVAGYKAVWQLIFRPFYWEKTKHGLSSFEHQDIDFPPDKKSANV